MNGSDGTVGQHASDVERIIQHDGPKPDAGIAVAHRSMTAAVRKVARLQI